MQVLLLRLSVLFSVKHSTCIIVTPLQMATTDHFMQQHRLDVYFKDVAVIGCQKAVADEDLDAFRAAYFQTVAQGNHVIGRDYAFVTSVDLTQLHCNGTLPQDT